MRILIFFFLFLSEGFAKRSYPHVKSEVVKSKPAFPPNQLPNKVTSQSVFSLGFTVAEPSYNHSQFSTVQQLQDSSTLESQALSSSYHPPNLLHVSSTEVVSMSSFSCQLLTFRCCGILFQMLICMHYRPQIQRL